MKKICILQNGISFGGTDTFVINLCKGLIHDGYLVTVVLSVDSDEELSRENELLKTGANVVKTCHLRGVKSKLVHLWMLYKLLKHGKYDVFQTNIDLFNGPQLFVSWLAGVPTRECHSHNSQQERELSEGRTISIRLYQRIMRWFCWTFSNRRCGCSELAMDFLFGNKKWRKDKYSKVVHNGIDLSQYKKEFNREIKLNELGIKNKNIICTVGRISFQKNPEFLLEIFKELTDLRDDVDLVWCGKGDLENIIREKINKYNLSDRVHLLGNRNDISEILKSSDLFLLPSLFEGLAIVLIEAQAAALPCVVSNTISLESDCGSCIFIPLEQSAKYWAEQISKILDKKIILSVDQDKIISYGIEHMVKEMEEVFEQ